MAGVGGIIHICGTGYSAPAMQIELSVVPEN